MNKLTFITLAYPGKSVSNTIMMLESIREFGGALADSPVWVLFPRSMGDFNTREHAMFTELGAGTIPYNVDEKTLKFPFGAKVQAAAVAEKTAVEKTELLIWLDSDTIIIAEPNEFVLTKDKVLGYRPVHHKLLGLSWNETPDPFWTLIYQHCQTPLPKGFPMTTHVGEKIRPYFNAGTFVVRPGRGVLAQWWQVFQSCYRNPDFLFFYEKDSRYAIFMHQAVFTGVLLSMLESKEMQELSPSINYPLHLHQDIPQNLHANSINDLVTVRYENIFNEPGWQKKFPNLEQLVGWIETQLKKHHTSGDAT